MNRNQALAQIIAPKRAFDVVVVGGGATGVGIALDAAARGLRVALLEQADFGSGTSSRSTKIIHGGVRYLAQGRISLVQEALRERGILLRIAPHLVSPLAFVVPIESMFEAAKYFSGLKLYDFLGGGRDVDSSQWLAKNVLEQEQPALVKDRFRGAMRYFDAQFDDSRLLFDILAAAINKGALALNYARVERLEKNPSGRVNGIGFVDLESGLSHEIEASVVVNATGANADVLLRIDDARHTETILPSQGSHIVVDRKFLPGNQALLMPQTPDGRVMFAIPWLGQVLIGTTDTEVRGELSSPIPSAEEVDMILDVAKAYLQVAPQRADILSTFAGVRPLLRAPSSSSTASVSREHRIDILDSGLVTISGGKWTTYRLMAEQCVDQLARAHHLSIGRSTTADISLFTGSTEPESARDCDAEATKLHDALPYTVGECRRAVREEMARSLEDVLGRRTRALFLNAQAARECAPQVLDILREELGLSPAAAQDMLAEFSDTVRLYTASDLNQAVHDGAPNPRNHD